MNFLNNIIRFLVTSFILIDRTILFLFSLLWHCKSLVFDAEQ